MIEPGELQLDHGPPCRGCRWANLTMACAACGKQTAVVALASSECHIEWCASCWTELQAIRVGSRLPKAWPVGEYVDRQAHREQQRSRHRARPDTTPQEITPQALPWGKDENESEGAA
jgi:hypothetical protein